MRGQFYIISATVIIVMVASLINTLRTANPDLFQPLMESAGFQAYNAQRAASDMTRTAHAVYATSGSRAISEQILSNFTAESSLFAEKNGMSITWEYAIENLTRERTRISYNMTLKIGTTKMEDSFTITRLAEWRQRISITGPGQTTARLNFSENRVTNCTLQLNARLNGNQRNANITAEEYSKFAGWHYQLPLEVLAGAYNRTDALLEPYADFTSQFKILFGYPKEFDINSVRVVENNDVGGFLQEVPSQFIPIKGFHAQSNASGSVMWIMSGSTPAGTSRYYSILFDTSENGPKPAPNTADLTITDNKTSCYIEVNNSKARYRFLSGGCDDDSNSGGLKNAWIQDGSGHDLIEANNTYGQYFNGSTESGPILSYTISNGTIARSIAYQTPGFSVDITAYSSLPYYKMDINTSLFPWISEFSPVTEHHGGSLCEYRNDPTRKWAEVYSPFWNGEGYGIVGLNVSVSELYNSNYSCSRIRHSTSNLQNWTIYTLFRTPKYTAEDLYREKSSPPSIILFNATPYSGYCTSANITFWAGAGSNIYEIRYPRNAGPKLTLTGPPVSPTAIFPEEELSDTIIE